MSLLLWCRIIAVIRSKCLSVFADSVETRRLMVQVIRFASLSSPSLPNTIHISSHTSAAQYAHNNNSIRGLFLYSFFTTAKNRRTNVFKSRANLICSSRFSSLMWMCVLSHYTFIAYEMLLFLSVTNMNVNFRISQLHLYQKHIYFTSHRCWLFHLLITNNCTTKTLIGYCVDTGLVNLFYFFSTHSSCLRDNKDFHTLDLDSLLFRCLKSCINPYLEEICAIFKQMCFVCHLIWLNLNYFDFKFNFRMKWRRCLRIYSLNAINSDWKLLFSLKKFQFISYSRGEIIQETCSFKRYHLMLNPFFRLQLRTKS